MYTLNKGKMQKEMPITKWAEELKIHVTLLHRIIKKCSFETIQKYDLTIYVNEQEELLQDLVARIECNEKMKKQLKENK